MSGYSSAACRTAAFLRDFPVSLFDSARFETSAAKVSQLPAAGLPEIAFAGRSNAGKSTTINVITRQGRLAFASKTPGRTQLVNFFKLTRRIGESKEREDIAYLVDLPGYGYAKASPEMRASWSALVGGYLADRPCLTGVVIDSRGEAYEVSVKDGNKTKTVVARPEHLVRTVE